MKLSLVVPIYNVEKYVEQCLRSIFEQDTTEEFEVVIVDDCGTDQSMDIVHRVVADYPAFEGRVHLVYHPKNLGIGQVRKSGIQAAQGEYVYVIDSDDWIQPYAVRRILQIIDDYHTDVILFGYDDLRITKKPTNSKYAPTKVELVDPKYCMKETLLANIYYTVWWNKAIRRSIIVDNQLYPSQLVNMNEDLCCSYRIFYFATSAVQCRDILYIYRENPDSIIHTLSQRFQRSEQGFLNIIQEMNQFFQDHRITDSKILKGFDEYHITIITQLAFYGNLSQLEAKRDLFKSVTINKILHTQLDRQWYAKLIVIAWKLRLWPIVYALRWISKRRRG